MCHNLFLVILGLPYIGQRNLFRLVQLKVRRYLFRMSTNGTDTVNDVWCLFSLLQPVLRDVCRYLKNIEFYYRSLLLLLMGFRSLQIESSFLDRVCLQLDPLQANCYSINIFVLAHKNLRPYNAPKGYQETEGNFLVGLFCLIHTPCLQLVDQLIFDQVKIHS